MKTPRPPQTFSRRFRASLPWLLFGLLLAAILVLGLGISARKDQLVQEKKAAPVPAAPPINVVTQRLVPVRMEDSLNLPGVVEAWEDLLVSAEVAGQIVAIEVAEGDFVKQGQVLAEIDQRDFVNNLHAVEARQNLAQINFARLQKLAGRQLIAEADLDQAKANLKELDAALAAARLALARTTIIAPLAGVVNDLPARLGTLLAVGDPVVQLLDISRVKVEVAIPEADVAAVRQVTHGSVTLAALGDLEVAGVKTFLAYQPSSPAMVYPLQLTIDNPDHRILPGMFARAKVVKAVYEQALGIPLYAVLSREDEQFVFVVRDGLAQKRAVTTGFLQGWLTRVNGLQEGDEVVIVGHRQLEDGQPVKVIKTVTDPGAVIRQVSP